MGLFGRGKKDGDGSPPRNAAAVRLPALVVSAEAPPEHAPSFGGESRGAVRILVDLGSGPVQVAGSFRFSEHRWLVTGMDITVHIDPVQPAQFEIEWDAIPPMAERAAANDPTLADPIAASRRVAHALSLTKADTGTARQDAFAAAMRTAEKTPAPPGKLRAVVIVATIRGRFESRGGDDTGGPSQSDVTVHRSSAAVLSVNVPGLAPYAIYLPKFKYAKDRVDLSRGGMPALVSADDPRDIEIQWAEVPSAQSQLADRVAASMATAQQRMAQANAIGDQMIAAMGQAAGTPPVPGAPVPPIPMGVPLPASGVAGLTAMAPQMRQYAIDSLKRTLQYISDPAMRQMTINQYRAMGIELTEEDLPG